MVHFEPVDPNEFPNMREGRRGRVAYPIIKAFMETGLVLAKLDRTDVGRSLISLSTGLSTYVKSHELPIKIFQRQGELYLLRLDLDANGDPNPEYEGKVTDASTNEVVEKSPIPIQEAE